MTRSPLLAAAAAIGLVLAASLASPASAQPDTRDQRPGGPGHPGPGHPGPGRPEPGRPGFAGRPGPGGWHGPGGGPGGPYFHGRDFAHFGPRDWAAWRGGAWHHEWHDGRFGWWWFADGAWYPYDAPVYPYPTVISPLIAAPAPPPPPPVTGLPPPHFRYYCSDPPGYYPQVSSCRIPFQQVSP